MTADSASSQDSIAFSLDRGLEIAKKIRIVLGESSRPYGEISELICYVDALIVQTKEAKKNAAQTQENAS